jgi:pimeloyl-ACP methyl ester carboxylesterase
MLERKASLPIWLFKNQSDMKRTNIFKKALILPLAVAMSLYSQAQVQKQLRHFMQTTPTLANAIPYGNNPKAGRYIESGDAKIYYEVYGKGQPLVILHGGVVGSAFEMHQFIDSLSMYYQVIAVSTRGHGKSEMGSQAPTYERKAEDANAIINAVTKDSAIVLGFSDGAYTGYYLAAKHPGKVKRLIAIGAGVWKQGFRPFNNTRHALFNADSAYFKQQLAIMPEPNRFDDWLTSLNTYYSSVNIGKEIFGAVECPVLVMVGELDENAPLETVLAAYKMMPHAQLSVIPGAPHPVFLVNFPAVWTSMVPFLKL